MNQLIPVAAAMTGINITAIRQFLDILNIESFSDTAMRQSQVLLETVWLFIMFHLLIVRSRMKLGMKNWKR